LSPCCHPCIDVSKRKFLGRLFHHPIEERINIKKGIVKKHAMLQHQKNWMGIEIKGYAKSIGRQLEVHMGYDGKNENVVNVNGKHQ
jgi:hypothetical protein